MAKSKMGESLFKERGTRFVVGPWQWLIRMDALKSRIWRGKVHLRFYFMHAPHAIDFEGCPSRWSDVERRVGRMAWFGKLTFDCQVMN